MSNIEYFTKSGGIILCCDFKGILEKKIAEVCSKIGFDDSCILWLIYDPNDPASKDEYYTFGSKKLTPFDKIQVQSYEVPKSKVKSNVNYYGYCDTKEKKIYISTAAIMKDIGLFTFFDPLFEIDHRSHPQKYGDDFLANVIIDEITHIQTGLDHGTFEYDTQYRKNMKCFYNTQSFKSFLKKYGSTLSAFYHS